MDKSIDNSLEWYVGDKVASVTASEMKLKNKIKKLAKDYPNDVKILFNNEDGSILARVPRSWIKVNKPRTGGGNPNGGEALRRYRENKKKESENLEDVDIEDIEDIDDIEDIEVGDNE